LTMSSQRLTIWRHSQKSYRMPHMKNIYTPKKKTTATFCKVEVAVGCWVLSLSTNYRDFSVIVSSAAPKKCAWVDSTSKTQGNGVGDRSRKMVLSRSFDAWSRFAHHCCTAMAEALAKAILDLDISWVSKIRFFKVDEFRRLSPNFVTLYNFQSYYTYCKQRRLMASLL
jgi:hypothetical protein